MASSSVEHAIHPSATQAEDTAKLLLQFTCAYIPCAALWNAAELKVADLLAKGLTQTEEIARATRTNGDALFRILRLLAMIGVFAETEPRRFVLTPAAELQRSDHPQSMRDTVIWLADPFHFNIAG
jgi:hypothetical protein